MREDLLLQSLLDLVLDQTGFNLRRTQARHEVAYAMNNLTTLLCCFIEKGCLGHFLNCWGDSDFPS